MIRSDEDMLLHKYISIPQDLRERGLNTCAFVAGIVKGILHASEFVRRLVASFSFI